MSLEIRSTGCIAAVATIFLTAALAVAQSPATSGASGDITRSCSANPVLASPIKRKSAHTPKQPAQPEPAPICLEAKGEPIEVQEFLQTMVREQTWRIGENRASEDTWSFVRYLDPDELEKFANTKVLLEPVKFTSGKAAVTVRTTDLGDGYSRVQISAHFAGEGSSTDKVWGQPGSVWTLNTKGVLEKELVTTLQRRYKPVQ